MHLVASVMTRRLNGVAVWLKRHSPRMIKCKLAKAVCWLLYDVAIKAVICTLPSLFVSLDCEVSKNNEPTAHRLLKFMKGYKFVACAYLFSDVLPRLSCLFRIFKNRM